jgi:hypothetical protein
VVLNIESNFEQIKFANSIEINLKANNVRGDDIASVDFINDTG